ncbi:MAG TPA: carboxypeptidase-like regulatory domain-containing protein [Solirubrobacteraceae bacterium]|nr:carboxypeptidase-like regulatory domain-containing protein [Solirubrobacteraceae bacterium]
MLLATLLLLFAAPAAHAALTVSIKVAPAESRFGDTTRITGTVFDDGAPMAGALVRLDGKRYPFEDPLAPVATATTGADGSYRFERELARNWQFRVVAGTETSDRVRAYVFPATKLRYRARSSRKIKLIQRYRVPRHVRLKQRTIFYVGRRGRRSAPRAASGKLKRVRPGRYRSTAIVRLPAAWHGRFRYASCFRYTGGSGMGNPRASCPRRFKF